MTEKEPVTMDEREISVMPDQFLWAIAGHRVWEITAWRITPYGHALAVVPGSPRYQMLMFGHNVFESEAEAYQVNMRQIDDFRRLLDDLAELNVRHLM